MLDKIFLLQLPIGLNLVFSFEIVLLIDDSGSMNTPLINSNHNKEWSMNKKYNPQTTPTIYRDDSEMAWFHIDASGLILGRLASTIASILSGKHQVTKSFNSVTGDGPFHQPVQQI